MKVYQKLNAARKQFHKLQLKKTGLNKFAGYSYFELGDFLIPAMDVLEQNGLCAFISFGKDLATMQVVDVDTGESVAITSPMSSAALKGCHEVQQLGAVQTYLRRYLWVAALEIVEHDALDSSAPLAEERKVIKQGALQGIGDDLPEDWKVYLKDLAAEVTEYVTAKNTAEAKRVIAEANLDDTQQLFMERHLASQIRTALRKAEVATV